MDSSIAQNVHLPSADPSPEHKIFRETMEILLSQNAHLPSADPLPEYNVFCHPMGSLLTQTALLPSVDALPEYQAFGELTAMRKVVEPRLLRMESEIANIMKASISMKEALERMEKQQTLMSIRSQGKRVFDIEDHSRYLQDVDNSINAHFRPINLAPEFVEQKLARPSEEIKERSRHRVLANLQTASVKDADVSSSARHHPISSILDDTKEQMARPPLEIDHVPRPDKLIVGHDAANALAPVVNQGETVKGLRAEHVQLHQVDLPNFQVSLRKILREEFQNLEMSVIQQFMELQNCGKPLLSQSAVGENQNSSMMKRLAPVACVNNASNESFPEHDQPFQVSDSQVTVQAIETVQNPSAATISPGVKHQVSVQSKKSVHSETSEPTYTSCQNLMPTFDECFTQRNSDSIRSTDKDAMDVTILLQDENSCARMFTQDTDVGGKLSAVHHDLHEPSDSRTMQSARERSDTLDSASSQATQTHVGVTNIVPADNNGTNFKNDTTSKNVVSNGNQMDPVVLYRFSGNPVCFAEHFAAVVRCQAHIRGWSTRRRMREMSSMRNEDGRRTATKKDMEILLHNLCNLDGFAK